MRLFIPNLNYNDNFSKLAGAELGLPQRAIPTTYLQYPIQIYLPQKIPLNHQLIQDNSSASANFLSTTLNGM